jgi:DNA-binding CsgD family transcriptional regulator
MDTSQDSVFQRRLLQRQLSPRQGQILILMSGGFSNAEIGRLLHISSETVKHHAKIINRKLDARSRAHAVAIALREGIIE